MLQVTHGLSKIHALELLLNFLLITLRSWKPERVQLWVRSFRSLQFQFFHALNHTIVWLVTWVTKPSKYIFPTIDLLICNIRKRRFELSKTSYQPTISSLPPPPTIGSLPPPPLATSPPSSTAISHRPPGLFSGSTGALKSSGPALHMRIEV
ncbi:hypothetical protein L1987_42038 [Smallanthus sonchifolius]|uniref:Uncharacterized protein n=1 Tax=Smallanthus sonchifolius TaxID=185202 RepID=A0ACB9GWF5_9ASTR|nr:hypothetical protein L1987_42038 [Smallanthus sonchifolius]